MSDVICLPWVHQHAVTAWYSPLPPALYSTRGDWYPWSGAADIAAPYLFARNLSGDRVALGDSCPSGSAYVLLSSADYESGLHAWRGFTLADLSALLPAVALVWGVAWLVRRTIRQLR